VRPKVAEALPGGVWIRDDRDADLIGAHREWLGTALTCPPRVLVVVLGCPGTPPMPLDDVARFWNDRSDEDRQRVRFVGYGPVQRPSGEALGQALADLLGTPIICLGGIPIGDPGDPQLHTVTASGQPGWQVFVRELGYRPRTRPTGPADPAVVLSHRPPLAHSEPLAPRVYRYADDAVIEIVPAGLWIRPGREPSDAGPVRAAQPSAEFHTVVYDDATGAHAVRMRGLAEEVIARLDPATRERSVLLARSLVATALGGGPVAAGDRSAGAPESDREHQGSPEPAVITLPGRPGHVLQPGKAPASDAVTAMTSRGAFLTQVAATVADETREQ
jgi:hypothetical protein